MGRHVEVRALGPGDEAALERLLAAHPHSSLFLMSNSRASGLRDGDLPSARALSQIHPDLHALLELLDQVHQVVTGLPGAGRARERGDDPHPRTVVPDVPGEGLPRGGSPPIA